ncbi:ion transporter, putative [Bodo saltans]|uniref:Ion transporter, putative n=1 Tax=Bodo saltans TaxID=75058 RepID=A0A0S4IWT9_BODSA|nr:ion transporter, putative [Bodo saltans]|eukprot:CUG05879.1 ion transporter, putative [Bodo saltans]
MIDHIESDTPSPPPVSSTPADSAVDATPYADANTPTAADPKKVKRRAFSRLALLAKPLNAVKKVVKNGTLGAKMISTHVTEILREDLNINIRYAEFPSELSRELRSLENIAAYLRWLRGILCFFGIVSFALSLAVILDDQTRLSWIILVISIIAQGVLLQTYSVKATVSGLTNPIYRKRASLWYSPYFYQMLMEMGFWLIQCPPTFEATSPVNMLGFVVFARVYTIVTYMNNSTFAYRTFCRAMSALIGVPLSNSFYIRTSLIYRKTQTISVIITCFWLTLALMYTKAEGTPYRDSMWFIFVTVGTIGYGDISPVTISGRLVAFLAWVFALICIGYAVVVVHDTIMLREHERTMYLLFRSNELTIEEPDHAARLIQQFVRYYFSKKRGDHILVQNMLAWSAQQEVDNFRRCRLLIREAAFRFHESSEYLEAQALAGLKKSASTAASLASGVATSPTSATPRYDQRNNRSIASLDSGSTPAATPRASFESASVADSSGYIHHSAADEARLASIEQRVAKLSGLLSQLSTMPPQR